MSSTFSMSSTIGSAPISSSSSACSVFRMIPRGLSPRSARIFDSRMAILPWPPTMTTFMARPYPAGSGKMHDVATADLTVIGLGRSDPSAGEYIAEIQRRLAAQDKVGYELHAMGTSLEGSTEDILDVVAELHRVPFEMGLPRVYTVLKLDERRDKA